VLDQLVHSLSACPSNKSPPRTCGRPTSGSRRDWRRVTDAAVGDEFRKSPRLSGSGELVYPCGPEADAVAERADSMPASERRHRTIKELIEALQAERIPHPSPRALGRGRSDGVILAELPRKRVLLLGDDEAPGYFRLRAPDDSNHGQRLPQRSTLRIRERGPNASEPCLAPPGATRSERLTQPFSNSGRGELTCPK
jgi:hypothetical protein